MFKVTCPGQRLGADQRNLEGLEPLPAAAGGVEGVQRKEVVRREGEDKREGNEGWPEAGLDGKYGHTHQRYKYLSPTSGGSSMGAAERRPSPGLRRTAALCNE